jgi:asparagine synthase (glutamine-hydrolysing)
MCGISGAIGQIDPSIEAAVDRIDRSQIHRGPDGHGRWRSELDPEGCGVLLAHRRLAIVDLSNAGRQPMYDPGTGAVITYNGEIYNYRELRAELEAEGISFESNCDTEVILKLFARTGEACLDRLRGMFAFAIWEPRKERLVIARDRLGIKPLYLYPIREGDRLRTLLFASELRALLASNLVPRNLDAVGVSSFLWNGFVTGPNTLIRGIENFAAGQLAVIDLKTMNMQRRRYWQIPSFAGEGRSAEELNQKIEESVRMRLVSDVPLAVFLSGGVDSSVVAALASRASDAPIRSFNIGFEEAAYDESPHALRVANAIGAEHKRLVLTEDRFKSQLGDALAALDQPTYDAVNTYFVSRVVREEGITVALAGTGGDELCGGYATFVDLPKAARWSKPLGALPSWLRRMAASGASRLMYGASPRVPAQTRWGKLDDLLSTHGDLVDVYQVSNAKFTSRFLNQIFPAFAHEAISHGLDRGEAQRLRNLTEKASTLGSISMLELSLFVGERLLRDTDTTSMAVSLEVRVPLLDHDVIGAASCLDETSLYQPLRKKQLLRTLAERDLPAGIFDRPKAGFVLPIEEWCRRSLSDTIEDTLGDTSLKQDLGIDSAAVSSLWKAYQDGAPGIHWSRVWGIFVLMDWCRKHGIRI